MSFFPWEKLPRHELAGGNVTGEECADCLGLYGVQRCFQVSHLWNVRTISSAGELEESKVRKSEGGDLRKNDGH